MTELHLKNWKMISHHLLNKDRFNSNGKIFCYFICKTFQQNKFYEKSQNFRSIALPVQNLFQKN